VWCHGFSATRGSRAAENANQRSCARSSPAALRQRSTTEATPPKNPTTKQAPAAAPSTSKTPDGSGMPSGLS
jgi:hypothetical protein